VEAGQTAVEARAVAAAARALLVAVGVITVPAPALRVAVDPPAWEAGAWVVAVEEAAVADEIASAMRSRREQMKLRAVNRKVFALLQIICVGTFLHLTLLLAAQQSTVSNPPAKTGGVESFDNPEQATAVLIEAAEKFDVSSMIHIFGPANSDIVLTGEFPQDRQRATDFVAEAREKKSVSVDPKNPNRAFLLVGNENWPFPVPMVKKGARWSFDADAGRKEILYRRIGYNELDGIEVCHTYVQAQKEYAFQKREGYAVPQYAQRIVSTPGKQDGLAWQDSNGKWEGPLGENVARAIEQGYTSSSEPYHGYFFKILNGQGPAAPLGEMDFVVEGVMIGGFALAAVPAEYGVTGVNSFVVGHDGIVYQKDFGPASLAEFQKLQRFNPDKSWTPLRNN
jgi:hypothetical protein